MSQVDDHSESLYFLEQFQVWKRFGCDDPLSMDARTAEAIAVLDDAWHAEEQAQRRKQMKRSKGTSPAFTSLVSKVSSGSSGTSPNVDGFSTKRLRESTSGGPVAWPNCRFPRRSERRFRSLQAKLRAEARPIC